MTRSRSWTFYCASSIGRKHHRIFAKSPGYLSSNLFCSACALMRLNRLRVLKWAPHCPGFNRSTKRRFVRILELVNIFAKFHATLRAQRSWCKVSSCDVSSNFGAQGLRSWGSPPSVLAFEFGAGEGRLSFSSLTSATFSEAGSWLKLHESPFELCPCDFHWKHSPHFPGNVAFFPFWFLVTAPLSTTSFPDSEVLSSHHLINTMSHRSLQRGTVFKFSKRADCSPSRTGSRSKTFPDVPIIFRVSCGNPESRQSMVAHEVHTFG